MALNLLAPIARAMAALQVRFGAPGGFRYFGASNAGVHLTPEMAHTVAAVWACIDVIASAMSSSNWNVYEGVRDSTNKKALPEDGLQYILNTRFNPEMTAQAGKRALMIGAVGRGTGYAEIERDLSGRIIRLWPIESGRVDPRRHEVTGQLFYRITQEGTGGFVDMEPEDLFIIRGAGALGFAGDDMIAKAIQTIATAVALDQFAASYFGNGATLGGLLEHSGKLDDPTYARLQEQFNKKHRGARNAFRVGILEGGMKYTPITTDAEKAQLVNVKYVSVEEICRWFRVPPHKIAHLLRSTNNNIEHQGLEFTRDTLRPWKVEIEQEADYKLIPYRAKKFIELDVDWAEQGDYKSRSEAYGVLRNMGAFSANDVLRKLGENTIGAAGDIRIVQGANVRLEDVGAAYAAPNPAPPAAPQTDGTTAAWLTSVYSRIQRRYDNRAADLQRSGRADWMVTAREATQAYANEQISEMAPVLGDRVDMVDKWAKKVIEGCDPKLAAMVALR